MHVGVMIGNERKTNRKTRTSFGLCFLSFPDGWTRENRWRGVVGSAFGVEGVGGVRGSSPEVAALVRGLDSPIMDANEPGTGEDHESGRERERDGGEVRNWLEALDRPYKYGQRLSPKALPLY